MRRRQFLAAGLIAAVGSRALAVAAETAAPFQRGLLWRLSKPGVAPSWLFGTLHQPDRRLWPLAPPVQQAFAGSRQFIMEMVSDAGGALCFGEAVQSGGEGALAALVAPQRLPPLLEHLAARGVPPAVAGTLKLWAALLLVTTVPGPDGVTSMDHELYVRARQRRLRIDQLDSVDEQVAVFDDIPLETQRMLLDAAIDFHADLPAIARATVSAYLARDLAQLDRLGRALALRRPALAPHLTVLAQKVVRNRSVVMAYRMQPALRRGQAFVAVGASHLYGAQSVQQQLIDEYGWRVARVW